MASFGAESEIDELGSFGTEAFRIELGSFGIRGVEANRWWLKIAYNFPLESKCDGAG